jgi:hypothetical protein
MFSHLLAARHIDPSVKQSSAELLIGLEKVTDEGT